MEFTVLPKISEIFPKTIGFFHISRIELKVRRPKDVQRLKRDDAVVAWQFRTIRRAPGVGFHRDFIVV